MPTSPGSAWLAPGSRILRLLQGGKCRLRLLQPDGRELPHLGL